VSKGPRAQAVPVALDPGSPSGRPGWQFGIVAKIARPAAIVGEGLKPSPTAYNPCTISTHGIPQGLQFCAPGG